MLDCYMPKLTRPRFPKRASACYLLRLVRTACMYLRAHPVTLLHTSTRLGVHHTTAYA